jgi:O-antigen/teichoic acid export membrane protein
VIKYLNNQNNVIKNTLVDGSWRVLYMLAVAVSGLVMTALTARYFGPEVYGAIMFNASFVGLFSSLYQMGLERVAIDEISLSKTPFKVISCLNFLKLIGASITFIVVLFAALIFKQIDIRVSLMVLLGNVMSGSFGIEIYFIHIGKNVTLFKAKIILLLIYLISNAILLVYNQSVWLYLTLNLIHASSIFIVTAIIFKHVSNETPSFTPNLHLLKKMFARGWPNLVALSVETISLRAFAIAAGIGLEKAAFGQLMLSLRIIEVVGSSIFTISSQFTRHVRSWFEVGGLCLKKNIKSISHVTGCIAFVSWFIIIFLAGYIIVQILGERYSLVASCLKRLWLVVIVQCVMVLRADYLTVSNSLKTLVVGNVLGFVVVLSSAVFASGGSVEVYCWIYVTFQLSVYVLSNFFSAEGRRYLLMVSGL